MPTSLPMHYDILGIELDANQEDIRCAYRRQALATHPDKGGSKESFQEVVNAFEVLSSPKLRAAYDSKTFKSCQEFEAAGLNSQNVRQDWNAKRRRKSPKIAVPASSKPPACGQCHSSPLKTQRQNGAGLDRALSRLHAVLAKCEPDVRRSLLEELPLRVRSALLSFMDARAKSATSKARETDTRNDYSVNHEPESGAVQLGSQLNPFEIRDACLDSSSSECSCGQECEEDTSRNDEACVSKMSANHRIHAQRLAHMMEEHHCFEADGGKWYIRNRGISRGSSGYRAFAFFCNFDVRSRSVPSLEEAVELHAMLVAVKNIVKEASHNEEHIFLANFRGALSEVCRRHSVDPATVHLSFGVVLRWRSKLGACPIQSRITSDVQQAASMRQRLLLAKVQGWQRFREVWIDVLQEEVRVHESSWGMALKAPRTLQAAEAHVDAAWERGQAHRQHIVERMKCIARQLAIEISKKFEILQQRAQNTASRATAAQARAIAAKVAAKAKVTKASQVARLQWMRDPARTFEEILRGPPM